MNTKEKTLIVIVALVLVVVIVGIILIAFNAVVPQQKPAPTPTPTTGELKTNPPVIYDDRGQQELLKRVEERTPLSASDEQAKTKLLARLPAGSDSGTLYRTTNFSIDYLTGPNIFQVEILTTNIDKAKQQAVDWFLSQGFSQKAICTYPVQFYLNFAIAEEFRGKDISFSPLAPGCE